MKENQDNRLYETRLVDIFEQAIECHRSGDLAHAEILYRQAIAMKPDFHEAHSNLGAALTTAGELQRAIGHFREALKLKPDFLDAHNNLAIALIQIGQLNEAAKEFRRALEKGDTCHATEELGDIIFAMVNCARHNNICAEDALRATVTKFEKRFKYIEEQYRNLGKDINAAPLEEMDRFWEESKKRV